MESFSLLETRNNFTKYIIIGIAVILFVTATVSYSLWQINHQGSQTSRISSGCFDMEFVEKTNSVNLTNTYPISDEQGMNTDPYTFSIKNNCSIYGEYYISLDVIENNTTIDLSKIKVSLTGEKEVSPRILSTLEEYASEENGIKASYIIGRDNAEVDGEEKEYSFRMWIDESAGNEVMGQTIEVRLTITSLAKKQEIGEGDIQLAIYVDGVKTNIFPSKSSGKAFDHIECTNDEIGKWDNVTWGLTINNLSTETACKVYFRTGETLANAILESYGGADAIVAKGAPNFTAISTTNSGANGGMFAAADDYGTSYYYRGSVTNNNVMFAGFAWKIIRITGEGTIKLIYNGDSASNTTGTVTQINTATYAFNTARSDNRYVGYMYGTDTSTYILTHANTTKSNAMTQLETWYNTNISAENKQKVADTIYCSDRSMSPTGSPSDNTALGYGANVTYYMPYIRLGVNKSPSLKCTNTNDQFTISSSYRGNKALTYPVGLITADEIALSGGLWNVANGSYYLHTGETYWAMSPSAFSGNGASEFFVLSNGNLNSNYVGETYGLRPVINLSSNTLILSGDGTTENPYQIVME